MPKPYKKKSYKTKKPRYKRRGIDAGTCIVRAPSGMPDRLRVKLRYSQYISLVDLVGGVVVQNVFQGNSCYDPDTTGTGHQPYCYDQWSNLFRKYMVSGAQIKVSFNALTTNTKSVWVAIQAKTTSAPTTTVSAANERAYIRDAVLQPSGGKSQKNLSMYQSTKRMLGIPKLTTASPEFSALINASPGSGWWVDVMAGSVDTLTTFAVDCNVEIKYYVTFFDRNIPGQS